jgi:hypothetical protein
MERVGIPRVRNSNFMKVFVVFDFPEIEDVNSEDATFAIDALSEDLEGFAKDGEYDWYIDDAVEK